MARLYSHKKGKSGSKKPLIETKKTWLRYTAKEIEQLILKLARSGKTPSQIGLILRDSYGIPDVRSILKKRINQILKENKITSELPEDLMFLIRKQLKVTKHKEINKKDKVSKRGMMLTESKINRLVKYYKRVNKLPQDWKYDPEKLKFLVT